MYQPFQNLYQHLKQKDIKLFECLNKVSDYLEQLFAAMPVQSTLSWQPIVGLSNGWTATDVSIYGMPQFCVDSDSFVHFRGNLIPGVTAAGTVLFTLSSDYRPKYLRTIPITQLSGGSLIHALLVVGVGGAVQIYAATGATTKIYLDGEFPLT